MRPRMARMDTDEIEGKVKRIESWAQLAQMDPDKKSCWLYLGISGPSVSMTASVDCRSEAATPHSGQTASMAMPVRS